MGLAPATAGPRDGERVSGLQVLARVPFLRHLAALTLLGALSGILVSDRGSQFGFWVMERRQICWAHLIRKFVAFSEPALTRKLSGLPKLAASSVPRSRALKTLCSVFATRSMSRPVRCRACCWPVRTAPWSSGPSLPSAMARGWLAGHSRFGLYGGLVLLESVSRCLFALAVVIGVLAVLGLALVQAALSGIYSAALYRFAVMGDAPQGFDGVLLREAFQRKV